MNKNTPLSTLFFIAKGYMGNTTDRFASLIGILARIGIFLGTASLMVVLSVMNGLGDYQKDRIFNGLVEAVIYPQSPEQAVKNLPHFVKQSVPFSASQVVLLSHNALDIAHLIGVRTSYDDPRLERSDIEKRLPYKSFSLIITHRLARQLNLSLGDNLRVNLTERTRFTPLGRLPIGRVFRIVGIINDNSESNDIFTNLDDLNLLLGIDQRSSQGMRLFLQDPFQVAKLSSFFPADSYRIEDWRASKGEFFQAIAMEKNIITLLIALIIIVAVSNLVTSLSLMVVDKKAEIAILQTIGLKRSDILLIFLIQATNVGIFGTLLGGIIGGLLSFYLTDMMVLLNLEIILPTRVDPMQMALIMLFSLILSILSSLYPAYSASKITPASVLRYH